VTEILIFGPLALYVAALIWIAGDVLRKGEAASSQQFLKGTSNYRWRLLTLTLVATFIGPGYSLGAIDSTFALALTFGLAIACTPFHMLISSIYLLRSKKAEKIVSYRTAGAMIQDAFGSTIRPIFGIGLVTLYTIFSAQLLAGSVVILESVYGISGELIVIFVALIVASYSVTGGIPAVLRTDSLQFVLLLALGVFFVIIGLEAGNHVTETAPLSVNQIANEFNFAMFAGIAIIFILGDAFQPLYIQRAFFAKSAKHAGVAFGIAGVLAIFWFLLLTWVGINLINVPGISGEEQGVAIQALRSFFVDQPYFLAISLGIIGVAFIGLVMSTLDSVLNVAAGILVDDVFAGRRNLSEQVRISLLKLVVFMVALIGGIIASLRQNMIELLMMGYEFWIASFLPLMMLSIFMVGRTVRVPVLIVLSGVLVGATTWVLSFIYPSETVPWPVIGFGLNLVILIVGLRAFSPSTHSSDTSAQN